VSGIGVRSGREVRTRMSLTRINMAANVLEGDCVLRVSGLGHQSRRSPGHALSRVQGSRLLQDQRAPSPAVSGPEFTRDGMNLRDIWAQLLGGIMVVQTTFCNGNRSFALLAARIDDDARPPPRTLSVALLQRVLEGESTKALAIEVGLSVATVSTHCSSVLASIGCDHSVSRISALLCMAALAARGHPLGCARVDAFSSDPPARWIVSVANPAEGLRDRLSPAEYQIAQLAVDGKSYAKIASARGTSRRTIANQLASMFRKLGVSGRAELRALAIREHKLNCVDRHELGGARELRPIGERRSEQLRASECARGAGGVTC
jgi:DNA-binding CsgD family transcriptional regulator